MTAFQQHTANIAACTTVNMEAYKRYEATVNLAKLQALGKAFCQGWLHNVMTRITPMTARNQNDYVMMADLFIHDAAEASALLETYAADLTRFAVTAGVYFSPIYTPPAMESHMALWREMALLFAEKFGINAPAFRSAVIAASPKLDADIAFVRGALARRAA
ncbi:MAG: hypothetical protein H6922_00645 [Pseudomonadaceae bacterium]|nr:hypothetical protein [Pseudomonadaceae bacterium]